MTLLLKPIDYRWSAPVVEVEVRDEPDLAEASALAIYDYSMGRLGSDLTLGVSGSDDSTEHRLVVKTEVVVDVPEVPETVGAAVVTALFTCQEVHPEITSEDEEYGVSRVSFSWTSEPYAVLAGQLHGTPHPVPALHASSASGSDGPFTDGSVVASDSFGLLPAAGQSVSTRFTFDDVVAQHPLRIVVGIRNEVRAVSNDWTYRLRLRSHWVLTSLAVDLA